MDGFRGVDTRRHRLCFSGRVRLVRGFTSPWVRTTGHQW